jgi:hypothetical protein
MRHQAPRTALLRRLPLLATERFSLAPPHPAFREGRPMSDKIWSFKTVHFTVAVDAIPENDWDLS